MSLSKHNSIVNLIYRSGSPIYFRDHISPGVLNPGLRMGFKESVNLQTVNGTAGRCAWIGCAEGEILFLFLSQKAENVRNES